MAVSVVGAGCQVSEEAVVAPTAGPASADPAPTVTPESSDPAPTATPAAVFEALGGSGIDLGLSGDLVAIGQAGLEMWTEIGPLAPADLQDEVAIVVSTYTSAAAGDMLAVIQQAPDFATAILALLAYCGITAPG